MEGAEIKAAEEAREMFLCVEGVDVERKKEVERQVLAGGRKEALMCGEVFSP